MDLNLKQYENDSTLIWLINNLRLPKGAPWEFEDRQWQLEIIDDKSDQIVCRKPTQIGMSTVFLGKMLHFADMHQCRATMTLPRQDDVYDMVNSRLSEIIDNSPYLAEKMVGIDNVRMKQFGKSWIHFVEMSVPPRMMDVDWMLNDEVDLSNADHLEQAISRMDASKFGYHHRISTPTIHDYGIDALYKLSDMKKWVVKCGYCSHEQELIWEKNIAHDDGVTWYKCARCGNQLHAQDIREGRWVKTGNTNSDVSGYQISQLMCTYIDPNRLWLQSKTMKEKNFHNFRLGLPYTATTGGFDRETITSHSFISNHKKEEFAVDDSENDDGVYVLGCDQGDNLHVCVGKIYGNTLEIVYLAIVPFELGFEEIGRLINRFKVRRAVIDGLPNHHSARRLVDDFPHRAMTAYFGTIDKLYNARDIENKITINKTDAYDHLLYKIGASEIQFYGVMNAMDPDVDNAVTHITNMRRDIEEQRTRAGGMKTYHVWKNIGPDHYADAILYAVIASDLLMSNEERIDIIDISQEGVKQLYNDDNITWSHLLENSFLAEPGTEPSLDKLDTNDRLSSEEAGLVPSNPYRMVQDIRKLYED